MSNITVVSSEDSCSYPDDCELELGLGLSLAGRGRAQPPPTAVVAAEAEAEAEAGSWDPYSVISSAKELTSSSSSAATKIKDEIDCCGAKMAAPSSPPAPSALRSQVAGWPPVANYRMNSFVNHAKLPAPGKSDSNFDKREIMGAKVDEPNHGCERDTNNVKERGLVKISTFVKVNVDGISIGRKVDLNAHSCYATLAHTLDQMFDLSAAVAGRRWNVKEQFMMDGTERPALSFDGSSEFVLTYEDKEGDWMLVGDVHWEMFLTSVNRLRIRKSSQVNGPALKSNERNMEQLKTKM